MSDPASFERLVGHVMVVTGLDRETVLGSNRLVTDEIVDSLRLFELFLRVEEEFGEACQALTSQDFESVAALWRRLDGGEHAGTG